MGFFVFLKAKISGFSSFAGKNLYIFIFDLFLLAFIIILIQPPIFFNVHLPISRNEIKMLFKWHFNNCNAFRFYYSYFVQHTVLKFCSTKTGLMYTLVFISKNRK